MAAGVSSAQPVREHALNIVIPGIDSQASNTQIGNAATLSPTRERYVVVIDSGEDEARDDAEFARLLGEHPSTVPADHVIRVKPGDPASLSRLREVAERPSVTVVIDMPIGLRVGEKAWREPTRWAGVVAATIAQAHVAKHADSRTLLLGHSAGTEAMVTAQNVARDWRGAAPPGGQRRALFDHSVALSPRNPTALDRSTLLVLADGDFRVSPRGAVPLESWLRTVNAEDAVALSRQGYTVVRAARERDVPVFSGNAVWNALALTVAEAARIRLGIDEKSPFNAPRSVDTHMRVGDLNYPDAGRISVYLPHAETPEELSGASLGPVLKEMLRDDPPRGSVLPTPGKAPVSLRPTDQPDARPAPSPPEPSVRDPAASSPNGAAGPEARRLDRLAEELRQAEPTPGIGGISLTAVAAVPIDPAAVLRAAYRPAAGRLVLEMRNGRTVVLPAMDPEALRLAHEIGYLRGEKPEISITQTTFTMPDGRRLSNLAPPGRQSVHYLGGTAGTRLGLVLALADQALFTLAFGSTAAVSPVAERVPGYHSLAEMFPEKYTDHPGAHWYAGDDDRVILHSSRVELVAGARADTLAFGATRFAVRFSRAGAAEAVFGAFFEAYHDAILGTDPARPLRMLVPYAQAFAVMRWLRGAGIAVDAAELRRIPVPRVFTPRHVPALRYPRLEELAPRAPVTFFGRFGPVRIVDAAGRETRITYARGRPVQVERADGATLAVLRDHLGAPLALRMLGTGPHREGAFYLDPEAGPVFADGVSLRSSRRAPTAGMDARTHLLRVGRREETVALLVSRFALQTLREESR